jgi:hypothetical protein
MTILRQRPWLTLLLALLPVALTALAFVWVLTLREPASAPLFRSQLPHEAFDPARCTWACHNHGCQHQPQLPAWLASDDGLFGQHRRSAAPRRPHPAAQRPARRLRPGQPAGILPVLARPDVDVISNRY